MRKEENVSRNKDEEALLVTEVSRSLQLVQDVLSHFDIQDLALSRSQVIGKLTLKFKSGVYFKSSLVQIEKSSQCRLN